MATQNLVSAQITAEMKTSVMQKVNEIKSSLSFLLSLKPVEIQGLFKAGNGYQPFLEKAHQTALSHPGILPAVFDSAEFYRDYALARDLSAIAAEVSALSNALQNTLTAVNSDALTAALDVYAAVKQNRDKVPGLNVAAEEMAVFFKKPKRNPEPVTVV